MEGPSLLRDCKISIFAKVRLKLYQPHTFWPMLGSDLILDSSSCSHFLPMWKLFWAVMCWRLTRKCEELLLCVSPDCLGLFMQSPMWRWRCHPSIQHTRDSPLSLHSPNTDSHKRGPKYIACFLLFTFFCILCAVFLQATHTFYFLRWLSQVTSYSRPTLGTFVV